MGWFCSLSNSCFISQGSFPSADLMQCTVQSLNLFATYGSPNSGRSSGTPSESVSASCCADASDVTLKLNIMLHKIARIIAGPSFFFFCLTYISAANSALNEESMGRILFAYSGRPHSCHPQSKRNPLRFPSQKLFSPSDRPIYGETLVNQVLLVNSKNTILSNSFEKKAANKRGLVQQGGSLPYIVTYMALPSLHGNVNIL